MYLKSSSLTLTTDPEGRFLLTGEDAVYSTFSTSGQRLRLLAVFKDRKLGEVVALCADLRSPGGHIKIPRATFEQDFALEVPLPPQESYAAYGEETFATA